VFPIVKKEESYYASPKKATHQIGNFRQSCQVCLQVSENRISTEHDMRRKELLYLIYTDPLNGIPQHRNVEIKCSQSSALDYRFASLVLWITFLTSKT
jgi:hypothetical protein